MSERIEVNPNIHFGKPCITGKRIPVVNVLELVGEGISFDEIIRDYYPDLVTDDIRACIRYAINIIDAEHEDRELAEYGMEDYLRGLIREDNYHANS